MTALEHTDVERLMRRALGAPDAVLVRFAAEELHGGDGQDLGVTRLTGEARVGAACTRWSLVGKRLGPVDPSAPPDGWSHPRREAQVYGSGLLADLPAGLSAPRLLGRSDGEGGSLILWLEDVADDGSRWTLDDYARAAQDLGRLNGTYLAERRAPREPWLSHRWLRSWLAAGADAVATLARDRPDPRVARVFPTPVVDRLAGVWDRREPLLAALDRLPQTFCHNDAFRRNLFATAHGTVAVDWAFAGSGPLGSELAPLVWGSLGFLEAAWEERDELERAVLDAYARGVDAAGARVSRRDIRRGYEISAALRYGPGVVRLMVPVLRDERLQGGVEQRLGVPFDEIVEHWAAFIPAVLQLARSSR